MFWMRKKTDKENEDWIKRAKSANAPMIDGLSKPDVVLAERIAALEERLALIEYEKWKKQ